MATDTTEQFEGSEGDLKVSLSEEFSKNPLISQILGEVQEETDTPENDDGGEGQQEESSTSEDAENLDPETETTEDDGAEEAENESSTEIDVDALTPEQRADLAVQLDSDIKSRLDTLSGEKADLEKQLTELQAQLDTGLKSIVSGDDVYPNAKSAEDVKKAMQNDYQWRNQLFALVSEQETESDDEGNEGYTIRGKFYPKQEVFKTIKEIDADIYRAPEQLRKFEKLGEVASVQAESLAEAEAYDWFKDEKSPTRLKYDEVMQNPEVKLLGKIAPSFAAKLPAIVAGWADKSRPRKKSSMKLPLRRSGGSGSITSSAGGSGSGLRDPQRDAARKKLNEGTHSPEDVARAFFM